MSDAGQLGSSVGDDGQQEGDALAVWRSPEFLAGYYARDRDDGGAHLAEPHLDQAGIMVDPATEARRRSIAARPVPPVVPDSDDDVQPLDRYAHVADEWDRTHLRNGFTDGYDQAVSDLENLRQGRNRVDVSESSFDDQQRGVALAIAHLRASGSGVVPDNPALAPKRPRRPGVRVTDALRARAANASVPAVTDDEAATEVIARALHSGLHERQPIPQPVIDEANVVISGLRSAGFLVVHHTKET